MRPDIYLIHSCPESLEYLGEQARRASAGRPGMHVTQVPRPERLPRCWSGDPDWRDPLRRFVRRHEVARLAAHHEAWEWIARGRTAERVWILEDTAEILRPLPSLDTSEGTLAFPAAEQVSSSGAAYRVAWAGAYGLDRHAARRLVESAPQGRAIPVEDWLGAVLTGSYRPYAPALAIRRDPGHVRPQPVIRWPVKLADLEPAFSLQIVTVGTDAAQMARMLTAAGQLGYHAAVSDWSPAWDQSVGDRLRRKRSWQARVPEIEADICLMLDAYDTLPLATPDQTLDRYAAITAGLSGRPLVFGYRRFRHGYGPDPGGAIGWTASWSDALRSERAGVGGADTARWAAHLPSGTWLPDTQARIFGVLDSEERRIEYEIDQGYPRHRRTRYWPAVLHAPAPRPERDIFRVGPSADAGGGSPVAYLDRASGRLVAALPPARAGE